MRWLGQRPATNSETGHNRWQRGVSDAVEDRGLPTFQPFFLII